MYDFKVFSLDKKNKIHEQKQKDYRWSKFGRERGEIKDSEYFIFFYILTFHLEIISDFLKIAKILQLTHV
jgi:hypothetical protein